MAHVARTIARVAGQLAAAAPRHIKPVFWFWWGHTHTQLLAYMQLKRSRQRTEQSVWRNLTPQDDTVVLLLLLLTLVLLVEAGGRPASAGMMPALAALQH